MVIHKRPNWPKLLAQRNQGKKIKILWCIIHYAAKLQCTGERIACRWARTVKDALTSSTRCDPNPKIHQRNYIQYTTIPIRDSLVLNRSRPATDADQAPGSWRASVADDGPPWTQRSANVPFHPRLLDAGLDWLSHGRTEIHTGLLPICYP